MSEAESIDQDINFEQKALYETIKFLEEFLDESIIKIIKQIFKNFNEKQSTLNDYELIVHWHGNLINILDTLIADSRSSENCEEANLENSKIEKRLIAFFLLKDIANKLTYTKRIEFMRYILLTQNKKEILFGNVLFTKEEINKQYRKLSLYFHPDKINTFTIPSKLLEKCRNLGNEVFICISEIRNLILSELEEDLKQSLVNFHKEKANEFWKIAIDYRNAYRSQWDKLKILKKLDIIKISSEQLRKDSIYHANLAYKEYRAACKLADENKQLKIQLELRRFMALALYISDQILEAQLYALCGISLIYRYPKYFTREDLIETKNIFDKVNGVSNDRGEVSAAKLSTEVVLKKNNLVKLENLDDDLSYFERKAIRRSINDDLEKLSNELVLKANRSLVSYQANMEEILHTKTRTIMHKAFGIGILGVAVAAGVSVPLLSLNIFSIAGGLGLAHYFYKPGIKVYKESNIRKKLNEIMKNVIQAYDKGEYQKIFEILATNYEADHSLIPLMRRGDYINHESIIIVLVRHGFRPDGIAYLLNLIGEVLISGKVKVKGMTTEELKMQGSSILCGVLSETLQKQAQKLDSRIIEWRKKSMEGTFHRIMDFILLREYHHMAKEYISDSNVMPFVSRLEEIRITARINFAVRDVLNGGSEEFERAKDFIKDIRSSINNQQQFIGMANTRLEILEDFLWIVNGNESSSYQFDDLLKIEN